MKRCTVVTKARTVVVMPRRVLTSGRWVLMDRRAALTVARRVDAVLLRALATSGLLLAATEREVTMPTRQVSG